MPNREQNAGPDGPAAEEPPFDEALTELESVVRKLESGELQLEQALGAFEEGMRLSKLCESRLTEAETRIRELVEGADGAPEERPADLPDLEGANG